MNAKKYNRLRPAPPLIRKCMECDSPKREVENFNYILQANRNVYLCEECSWLPISDLENVAKYIGTKKMQDIPLFHLEIPKKEGHGLD